MDIRVSPYTARHRQELIEIWERSVLATHHFLQPGDFAVFKDLVSTIDFGSMQVCVLLYGENAAGFIGVAGRKVEMLFVDPGHFGKGYGKRLLRHAVDMHGADEVDVNEQNEAAAGFYENAGFQRVGRSELDGTGKPYPILHMRLR